LGYIGLGRQAFPGSERVWRLGIIWKIVEEVGAAHSDLICIKVRINSWIGDKENWSNLEKIRKFGVGR
jgi:hypothetical protein